MKDVAQKPIVLVGMMGVGKTSVGRALARKLDVTFTDLDHYIEKKVFLPVSEIFALLGEEYFREAEEKALAELLDEAPKVIALGGGAFISENNRMLIKQKAISIWLTADMETILERVSRNDRRPLLRGGDKREILEGLLAKRREYYAMADLEITCQGLGLEDIAICIIEKLLSI